ncbi:MAG: translation initiation factor [Thermoleophilia bacterium]|jgi:translation initiation factor 1
MAPGNRGNARLVYSTEIGRVDEPPSGSASRPAGDGIVRVGRTKAGRKGKTVTLVTGLPQGDLGAVATELKKLCGSGGAVKDGVVEIQGDHRDRVVARLEGRYRVKLAGG